MDRMAFIPGPEAKEQIFNAKGRIFFSRQTALDFADEFATHVPMLYQTMCACISDGEQVDIYFGLREPDPAAGQEEYPSGELVGHTWATIKAADGRERSLWEVGRRTPAAGEAHAARAFNAYREAMAQFLGLEMPPSVPVNENTADMPTEFNDKPVISRALAPSNLYFSSGRIWYFVDLSPPCDAKEPAILSRPMRSFDALILSAIMTLVMGSPPLVFGIANAMETLGKLPTGFIRANYEADETVEPPSDRPILVL